MSKIVFLALVGMLVLGANATCNKTCVTDGECGKGDSCQFCLIGHCGAGCGQDCAESSDCLDPNCDTCDSVSKKCIHKDPHNVPCGGDCKSDAECESPCLLCLDKKCGAGCGQRCEKDSQCGDANCNGCVNNTCQHKGPHNVKCGGTCKLDEECEYGNCSLCIQGKCGAGCGGPCGGASQCADPNCNGCVEGACKHVGSHNVTCGGSCSLDEQCETSCPFCVKGKCITPCNYPCKKDSDCAGPDCPKCYKNVCWHPVDLN